MVNTIDDPTITELTFEPELEVTKTYSLSGDDNVPDVGETVTYFIAVENTGNVFLQILSLLMFLLILVEIQHYL